MQSRKTLVFCVFFVLVAQSVNALIRVSSPVEFEGEYEDSKLKLHPLVFNLTAQLTVGEPFSGCIDLTNTAQVNGTIVIVSQDAKCSNQEKADIVKKAGGIGIIILSQKSGVGVFGFLYNFGGGPTSDGAQIPAINAIKMEKVIEYIQTNGSNPVIITITNTDRNPWLEIGHSGAGIFLQAFFLLYGTVTLVYTSYKLRMYIKYKGLLFHVTQVSLVIEILAAIVRILWMLQPLSWYYYIWNPVADSLLYGFANDFSFMTDLLITFYWQEILMKVDRSLSNKLLNNLDKFRIPYIIVIAIVWVCDILGSLGRGRAWRADVDMFTASGVITLIFLILVGSFFIITGTRILMLSSRARATTKTRRVSRLMIMIICSGAAMFLQFIALVLFVSSAMSIGAPVSYFIFFLYLFAAYSISFAKILAFETPKAPFTPSGETGSKENSSSKDKDSSESQTIGLKVSASASNNSRPGSLSVEDESAPENV